MNDHDDYPFTRPGHLKWLAAHGLCDPETAAEYVGRKLLSAELFARARKEYQEVTRNYAPAHYPDFLGKFTLRKPDEYPLLEFWHIGLGPNITYGALVARRTAGRAELLADSEQQSLIVRYGYPPMWGVETSETQAWEGSISQAKFQALLEPLKHIRVPPYPGEAALVLDGAIIGFEVVLGSTRFSYQWHSIPPAGWEPIADWLGTTIHELQLLTGTPIYG